MINKDMLLVALVCLLIGMFAVIWASRGLDNELDKCELLVDSIQKSNAQMQIEIDSLTMEIGIVQKRLDSLRKERNKIIVEYISIYEEIDSADADALLMQFKSILPKDAD